VLNYGGLLVSSSDAEIPFDWILDRVTGADVSVTDYVLEVPAHCPNCGAELLEDALVVPADSV